VFCFVFLCVLFRSWVFFFFFFKFWETDGIAVTLREDPRHVRERDAADSHKRTSR